MRNLYRAFFPKRPHVVLGRTLRPYSNWHRLQLAFAKSPFLGFEGELSVAALSIAVSVCCTRYPQTFSAPEGALEFWLHRKAVRAAKRDPGPALRAWSSYVRNYSGIPPVFYKRAAKLCQCPAPLATWASLVHHGLEDAASWDQAIDLAAWQKVALAEAAGAEIGLLTESARRAMLKAGYGALMPELLEGDDS